MSEHRQVAQMLAASSLFGTCTPEAIEDCAARFRPQTLQKREMLFARGDPANHIYLVSEGLVRLAIATSEGRELSFQIVGSGELFGEIGVLDGRDRSAEAVALEATVAYRLEKSDFTRLRSAHPSVTESVILFLCARLRVVSDRLETIALYPLEARLARFLVLSLRGREEAPGKRVPLELAYSQTELAQLLGASRPKLNAALGELERVGAVKRTSDRLFCDRAKLAQIAQLD